MRHSLRPTFFQGALVSAFTLFNLAGGSGFAQTLATNRPWSYLQASPPDAASRVPPRWPGWTELSRLACIVVLILSAVPDLGALGVLVPAYFYPTSGDYWSALNQAAVRVPLIAIMNPNNGPSTMVNPDYTSAVNALRNAGGRVIGYVYSSYAARPLSEVKADIDRYHAFYTIDGFFIDEMTNDADAAHLAYYEALYQDIKAKQASYLVVGNPGINTPASYLLRPTVDGLVTFENNTGYPDYAPDPWTQTQSATAFSHLCYAVLAPDTMTNYARLAVARNAGYIYVTDDQGANPWDTLPSYWSAEVGFVETLNREAARTQPRVLKISIETNNTVKVAVQGTPGKYVLQASSNLAGWEPLATNLSPGGTFSFSDLRATNYPRRAYRTAQ